LWRSAQGIGSGDLCELGDDQRAVA